MTFSVIVPFLNEEKYIEQCIISLLGQDFKKDEYEPIFIDTGSTDSSVQIVKRYPQINLLKIDKKNPYIARNKGLEASKGKIIAFTDADCAVSKDWLRQIHYGLTKQDGLIALGKCDFALNSPRALKLIRSYENAQIEYNLAVSSGHIFGYTNNMAVKKEVFGSIGFFCEDSQRGCDTEFIQSFLLKYPTGKIAYLPQMQIVHLEIDNPLAWINKQYVYGRSSVSINSLNRHKHPRPAKLLNKFRYSLMLNNYAIRKMIRAEPALPVRLSNTFSIISALLLLAVGKIIYYFVRYCTKIKKILVNSRRLQNTAQR